MAATISSRDVYSLDAKKMEQPLLPKQPVTNSNNGSDVKPPKGERKTRDFTELGVYREVYPLVIENLKILGAVCGGGVTHSAEHPQAQNAVRPNRSGATDATKQQQQQRKLEFISEKEQNAVSPRNVDNLLVLAGRDNNTHPISRQLLLESARTSVDILANLAEGYNAFHSRDKADCYRRARSCLCRSQCFLQVLGSLGAIDNEAATKISSGYSSLTGSFSGLIRSMERGIDNNSKNGRRAAQQCFRT